MQFYFGKKMKKTAQREADPLPKMAVDLHFAWKMRKKV